MTTAVQDRKRNALQRKVVEDAFKNNGAEETAEAPTLHAKLLLQVYGDEPQAVVEAMLNYGRAVTRQRDELLAALKKFQHHLEEQPQLVRIVSEAFSFGTNGDGRLMVLTSSLGQHINQVTPLLVPDEAPRPEPLQMGYADKAGSVYLGPATELPLRSMQQHTVVTANESSDWEGVGEVVIETSNDQQTVLYAERDVAASIAARLEDGESLMVRHDDVTVLRVVDSHKAQEDWLDYPSVDGPKLDSMIYPRAVRRVWNRCIRSLNKGGSVHVALLGPTGIGKTSGVYCFGRTVSEETGKPFALIKLSMSSIGSSYYSETERTIARALARARKLAEEGAIVVVLVDEADALVGNSENRYEGSVDRRVRLSIQELLSERTPGVAVFLTMNQRPDSYVPAAIMGRFTPLIYPRPSRGQMARIVSLYADADFLKPLGLKPDELGRRVADFLFSDRFVVAHVHLQSGTVAPVRARDLHHCSPRKVRALIEDFCDDLDESAATLDSLWRMMESEFRSHALSANNVFELTFLAKPLHDQVKHVEPVAVGQ